MKSIWSALKSKGRISTLLGIILYVIITTRFVIDFAVGGVDVQVMQYFGLYSICIVFLILPSAIKIKGPNVEIEIED